MSLIFTPLLAYQIEALKGAGVDEVVLAINYQPEVNKYMTFIGYFRASRLTFVVLS